MDTKELDNMIPEDERPAMILPSDPEEPADVPVSETEELDPVTGTVPETPNASAAPITEESPAAASAASDTEDAAEIIPETAGDVSDEAVTKAAEESKEKKKTILRIGIAVGAVLLLLALGIGWFFLMGPGATRYMVQFDPAGGKDVDIIWVRKGRSVDLPETTREGYEFKGWTLNGKDVDDPFSTDSDVKLVAKWEGMEFTVNFNSAGGTPSQFKTTFKTGEKTVAPAEPTKKGFTFVRWIDADNKPFVFGNPMPAEDLFLFAEWSEKSYKVTFETDGGKAVDPLVLTEGAKFPDVKTTKDNYTFDHWEDKNGSTVKAGDVLPTQDITLYAKWKRNTFKVSFDSKGGSSVPSITVNAGDKLSLPADPTKENYNFVRWEDKNGTTIHDQALLAPEDVTLYAVWERITFTVTFDSRGGSEVAPIKVNAGDELKLPPNPTRKMYIFGCWEDKNGTAILEGALLTPHDITLYARWEREFFTVEFDSNGGSHVPAISVKNGERLTLPPDPTRPWSKFIRWEDANGNPVYDQALLAPEDITLYAVWESVQQLSVGPVGETPEIESVVGTDTFLNIKIYSNYSTTSLEANMDVTWEITDDYGCLYSVNTSYPRRISFVAVHNADDCEAEIKAIAGDGQTFRVTIYPVEGTP